MLENIQLMKKKTAMPKKDLWCRENNNLNEKCKSYYFA